MTVGFVAPTQLDYNTIFGKILDEKGAMSPSCIAQCTGCTCSCRCSCKAIDGFEIDW